MINWQKIDTVLLDMDGTLLDLHYDNHFWMTHLPKRYADIKSISVEESERTLYQHISDLEGTLNWYCLDYWSNSLDIDILALKKETQDKIRQRPHVDDFLQKLNQNDKNVFLVTNAHPAGIDIKFARTNIQRHFKDVFSSHQFQIPKEELGFWQALSKEIVFDPERTLFIDDNLMVLNTAAEFGIKHILGIHQPDSQKPRILSDVAAIHHFDEIMMGLH